MTGKRVYRKKNGELLSYRLTGKDKVKFEVVLAEFNGRITSIESHVQDFKRAMAKLTSEQKKSFQAQTALLEHVHVWMADSGRDVKEVTKEGGIKDRVDCVEKALASFKTSFKLLVILTPITIGIFGLIIKFWG